MKQAEPASWVCDGGGNHSSGDWSSVPDASRHLQDPLGQVRRELRKIIRDNDLDKALTANIAVKAREAPWSADITEKAQQAGRSRSRLEDLDHADFSSDALVSAHIL